MTTQKIWELNTQLQQSLAELILNKRVQDENPHDCDWQLIESGDQGPDVAAYDRNFAIFEAQGGSRATYFYVFGSWQLGAN